MASGWFTGAPWMGPLSTVVQLAIDGTRVLEGLGSHHDNSGRERGLRGSSQATNFGGGVVDSGQLWR
jgi:hypothetical protein